MCLLYVSFGGDVRFGRYKPTKKKQISTIAVVDYTAYDVISFKVTRKGTARATLSSTLYCGESPDALQPVQFYFILFWRKLCYNDTAKVVQDLRKFSRTFCYFILFYFGAKWENSCTVGVQEFCFVLFYFIANGWTAYASENAPGGRFVTFSKRLFVLSIRMLICLSVICCHDNDGPTPIMRNVIWNGVTLGGWNICYIYRLCVAPK